MLSEEYLETSARILALEMMVGILLDHSPVNRETVLRAIEKVADEDRSNVTEIDPEVGRHDARVRQALRSLVAKTREGLELADAQEDH